MPDVSNKDDQQPYSKIKPKDLPSHPELQNSSNISIQTEKIKASPTLEIEPSLCKPWKYHNRDRSWLNNEHCQDLISSIQKNGQLSPVLLRKIEGDPHCDYEIIYGVRRWFACTQTNRPILAHITEADDKTCMVLMHTENADSKDITEFERAISFAQQIKSGVFNTQGEMAEMMGLTQGYISKLINAAEIFEYPWIKDLFHYKRDIPIKHAYELSILLKNPLIQPIIKNEAEQILSEKKATNLLPTPHIVLKRLIRVSQSQPNSIQSIIRVQGKSLISCSKDKFGNFSIQIRNEVKHLKLSDIEEACLKVIREYVKKLLPEE